MKVPCRAAAPFTSDQTRMLTTMTGLRPNRFPGKPPNGRKAVYTQRKTVPQKAQLRA